ncbi:hypothetical protein C8R44DRAFT_859522 [Mycena epipterygia]|nr:hypothetical protein C8R44DRAFT_859522 [Mycena epipterygia]
MHQRGLEERADVEAEEEERRVREADLVREEVVEACVGGGERGPTATRCGSCSTRVGAALEEEEGWEGSTDRGTYTEEGGVLQGEAEAARYIECIGISPADDTQSLRYNTHQRIEGAVAEAHIKELAALTPHVVLAVPSPFLLAVNGKYVVTAEASADLDTSDDRLSS